MTTILGVLTILALIAVIPAVLMAAWMFYITAEEVIEDIRDRIRQRKSEKYNETHPATGLEKLIRDAQDKLRDK